GRVDCPAPKAALAAAIFGLASLLASAASAADNVVVGSVGSTSANQWPLYIALKKGFFAAEGLNVDTVFAQSNASVVQQLAAGSTNVATSAGLVDPIRAIEKGAPLGIVRIEIQAPPYALLARRDIKEMKELKGKTVIVGGAKDITRIFTDRMLAAHGLKPGDFDYVFAGATNARFSALQSGGVDAALLTAPFNFYAESAGFTNLGFTFDYLSDMPFAGVAMSRTWAAANPDAARRFLGVMVKTIGWFYDERNRAEAVKIMAEVSKLKLDDVEKAYDFLGGKKLFEPTGKVSKAKLGKVVDALRELGDVPADFAVDRLFLPGVTQVVD
ncbi:MAG TPA: ABC transporter substrate-binding protein, partial [Xanthobacteraceae bacterium]|nr:ABC transporter substrate-binding protein [Xanthobacteraceae bacterium]